MTMRAESSSSPVGPGPMNVGGAPGLPPRGVVRLRALVLIRWAAVAGQLLTAAVVHWGLDFGRPVLAVGGTIALSALLNLTVSLGRPASARIDDREATIFLAFDILQLAVLLYLTGGLLNPFALLLLAPVAIGATILSRAADHALLQIADTGCGMSEDFVQHQLFKPFATTKGKAGMGMGVYESLHVVRAVGGRLSVASTPGAGTTFQITLPLDRSVVQRAGAYA